MLVVSAVAVLALATCRSDSDTTPEKLSVGIGLESVTDPTTDWAGVRERFDAAGVAGFTVSMGRPEWIGFAWEEHEDDWAPAVHDAEEDGRDLLGEAIEILSGGTDRTVTLTLDVLSPAAIEDDPGLAGAFPDGSKAEDFPSATALHSGAIGDRIVAMCEAASDRYSPDRIALTELLGDTFFSDADEALFADMTGQDGFPRADDGEVDLTDETVAAWQSEITTDLLHRCGESADVQTDMDVRVSWDEPGSDRSDSGHRYADVYETGSHLTLWAYTGLAGVPPEATAELAEGMRERFSRRELARTTLSVGLWSEGDETLSPQDLSTAVGAAASVRGGPPDILVTPLSMLNQEHWEDLAALAN